MAGNQAARGAVFQPAFRQVCVGSNRSERSGRMESGSGTYFISDPAAMVGDLVVPNRVPFVRAFGSIPADSLAHAPPGGRTGSPGSRHRRAYAATSRRAGAHRAAEFRNRA